MTATEGCGIGRPYRHSPTFTTRKVPVRSAAVAFLTVLLVVGSLARITILVLRPSAARRFRQPNQRGFAARIERIGDAVVFITVVSMLLFGYRHHPAGELVFLWAVGLCGGFAAVLLAHALARNRRVPGRPYRS